MPDTIQFKTPGKAELFAKHKERRDKVIAESKQYIVEVYCEERGRSYKHIPVGAPVNPKNYAICGQPTTGEDALEGGRYICNAPAGRGTAHSGYGPCYPHSKGEDRIGPDAPNFKDGRTAKVFKSTLRAKFRKAAAEDENPLDIFPELEAQKQLFYMGLDKLQGQWENPDKDWKHPLDIENVRLLGNDIVTTASKIVNMRNQTAWTNSEIMFLQLTLGEFIEKFIAPNERAASIAWLLERVPFSTDGPLLSPGGPAEGD